MTISPRLMSCIRVLSSYPLEGFSKEEHYPSLWVQIFWPCFSQNDKGSVKLPSYRTLVSCGRHRESKCPITWYDARQTPSLKDFFIPKRSRFTDVKLTSHLKAVVKNGLLLSFFATSTNHFCITFASFLRQPAQHHHRPC